MIVIESSIITGKNIYQLLKEGGFIKVGKYGIRITKNSRFYNFKLDIVLTGKDINNSVYFKDTHTKIIQKKIIPKVIKIDKIIQGKSKIANKTKGSIF